MAKFVLAGKADCPYYAKAELLADSLQRSLPNFSIHKICIQPSDWTKWLETTCTSNGWRHEHSPLIWRELIDRGGKGMLLGGFSDFLEHLQGYYGATSAMSTELMMKIAEENLHTRELCDQEEVHRQSLIKPLHIWISSALHPTCYSLIPMLFAPEVLRHAPTVSLHLLDVEGDETALHGLRMETEDLALPRLHQVTVHTHLGHAFRHARVIILLDDRWPDSGEDRGEEEGEGEEGGSQVMKTADRYRGYGRLIDERAHRDVAVIVAGDRLVNLKCCLLLESAPAVDSSRFIVVATQLEYEARAHIAHKLRVKAADVTDVIVWGNISGSSHVDLQRAKVFQYEGAIWGPSDFSRPVLEVIYDRKWLESDFLSLVRSQRDTIASKTQRTAAMSATNGIIAVLKAWNGSSSPEVFSLGVLSTGQYDIPAGIVFSMPVSFRDGRWSVLSDITIGDELSARLQLSAEQLQAERDQVSRISKSMA